MGARDTLDRFYTPDGTSKKCIDHLDLSIYDVIIEPSAGAGSFSSKLPEGSIALDIFPRSEDVARGDWLETTAAIVTDATDAVDPCVLVVGNPPFGKRCTLAKAFITHAVEIGADTIGFILPNTFTKMTNQRCFPEEWRLAEIIPLTRTENTFVLSDDEEEGEIFIPCSFFIWTHDDRVFPGCDLRDRKVAQPEQFSYLGRGDESADFSVNGNNGHTKDLSEITNPKAEHYIKVSDGCSVEEVRNVFDSIDYDFQSSVNGGVAWVSQNDINKMFLVAWSARGSE